MTDVTPPGTRVQIISARIMLNNMAHDNMVFPCAEMKNIEYVHKSYLLSSY